jgi:hypothetical protein
MHDRQEHDLLRNVVLENLEVGRGEPLDERAVPIADGGVDLDEARLRPEHRTLVLRLEVRDAHTRCATERDEQREHSPEEC